MDDLELLEQLSLVSKVTSELQNHLGTGDKTLAEFLIAQRSKCSSVQEFTSELKSMEASMPDSLISSIDRLVILMHPSFKKAKRSDGKGPLSNADQNPRKRLRSPSPKRYERQSRYERTRNETAVTGRTHGKPPKARKRETSTDRWAAQQLRAAGIKPPVNHSSDEGEDEDDHVEQDDEEEEIDIEVRDDEPPFLAGQTKQSLELSPIRVVKAPDGSMNRAAMQGSDLAKERREVRDAEAKDKAAGRAAQSEVKSQWDDPLRRQDQQHIANHSGTSQANGSKGPVPEWKRNVQGKESFGKRTTLSIKEQRESLPVFKLRKQLLDAIASNQLLIVVGDTGSGVSD